MPIRAIDLTDSLDSFIESNVRSGSYVDASAVVREGLALLRDQQDYTLKVEALKVALIPAEQALARGEVHEVALHDLDDYLAGLGRTRARVPTAR